MQSFLLTGLWRLKMHNSRARSKILKGSRSEQIAARTAKRAIRANKMTKNVLFKAVWGSKKVSCLIESSGKPMFEIM